MKKLAFVIILVFGFVFLTGCTDKEETDTGQIEPTNTMPADGDILAEMLDKSAQISCVNYEMEVSMVGAPFSATTDIWVRDEMVRIESSFMGGDQIILMNMEDSTMYKIVGAEVTEEVMPAGAGSALDKIAVMEESAPKVIGKEVIDDKDCVVVEYTTPDGIDSKMWLWEEYGFPVKMETVEPKGTTVSEYKSIEFECAPESMFELPENDG